MIFDKLMFFSLTFFFQINVVLLQIYYDTNQCCLPHVHKFLSSQSTRTWINVAMHSLLYLCQIVESCLVLSKYAVCLKSPSSCNFEHSNSLYWVLELEAFWGTYFSQSSDVKMVIVLAHFITCSQIRLSTPSPSRDSLHS